MSGLSAIQVFASPLPFSNKQIKHTVLEGTTISDVVNEIVPNGYDGNVGVIVTISGHLIPFEYWSKIRPKQGSIVNIRVIPSGGGGGGKNPLATILSIAVSFAAPYLAGAYAVNVGSAIFGGGVLTSAQIGFSKFLIGASVAVLGRLAIAAIAPPPKQLGQRRVNNPAESPTQFIEGAQNSLVPYGVVPICLGTNRMFPLQAARPYNETVNRENYVRQLFTYGYGKVILTDYRIGETSLSEFSNVEISDRTNGDLKEPTSIYSNSVYQENFSVLLKQTDGFVVRQTQSDADEAIIDVNFQGLVTFDSQSGAKNIRSVDLEFQYADVNDPENWQGGVDFKTYSGKVFNIPPPLTQKVYNGNYIIRGSQEHAIFLNAYTGNLTLVSQNGFARGNNYRYEPLIPPADSYRIASFIYENNNGVLSIKNFSDDRNPSLFSKYILNTNSFKPTITGSSQITVSSGDMASPIRVTGKQTEPFTVSYRIVFPSRSEYLIRIKRKTADTNDQYIIDKAYFSSLKTVTHESPVNEDFVSGTAIRMKATDQLNGSINQFNVIVSSVLPDYDLDSDTWIERITDNPASLYRYVLQGQMNAKALPDSKINLEDIQNWHTYCLEQGFTYNKVIDYETSLEEILKDIASAGAASPAFVDGKRTIIIDKLKDDIVQIITPRNSWGYEGEMIYSDIPDAFRVTFRNAEKGFQQDELIVFNDGFTAENAELYETLDLQYCTNSDLAYKTARRHLATVKLRPEIYSFSMDVENLVALRGDRIKFVNDVSLIGVGDGRIKELYTDSSGLITGFKIDDTVSIPSTGTYYTRIRLKDGSQLYKEIITSVGSHEEFDFQKPFSDVVIDVGDLCYFTLSGQEKDLVILSILPGSDLTAQITALDYAPEIFDAANSFIPAFNSNITTPLEFIRPTAPVLIETLGDETVMQRNSDGSFLTRLIIGLENQNEGSVTTSVKIRETGTTVFRSATVLETSPEQVIITGLESGTRYDIHIRYRRAESSTFSSPLEINNFLFVGSSGNPQNVTNFKINVIDSMALLSWDANTDIDISHYKIKFSGVFTGASWATSQTLENVVYETRLTTPFQSGTYLIKAVDLTGNESEIATAIITYDLGSVRNVVKNFVENPDWFGVKDNVSVIGNNITMIGSENDGYYYINKTLDLGAKFFSILSSSITAGGNFLNNIFDEVDIFNMPDIFGVGGNNLFDFSDIFNTEDIFGIGNDGWEVELEYRTTENNTSYADVENNLANTDISLWPDTRGVIYTNNNRSPNGYLEAHSFIEDGNVGQHVVRPEQALTLDFEHCYSIFLRSSNRWARVLLRDDDDKSYIWVNVNLQDGSILSQLAAGNAVLSNLEVIDFGNGWYRVIISGVINTSGGTTLQSYIYSLLPDGKTGTIFYNGDNKSSVEFYGVQILLGSEPYSPVWSDWFEFRNESLEFRGIQFRLLLRSLQSNIGPLVSYLSVLIDMPDRIERGEDIIVPTSGVTITYPFKFKENPAVAITIQDGLSNDEIQFITKTIEGFSFRVYNTTSASYVERNFDYISSGYGKE